MKIMLIKDLNFKLYKKYNCYGMKKNNWWFFCYKTSFYVTLFKKKEKQKKSESFRRKQPEHRYLQKSSTKQRERVVGRCKHLRIQKNHKKVRKIAMERKPLFEFLAFCLLKTFKNKKRKKGKVD